MLVSLLFDFVFSFGDCWMEDLTLQQLEEEVVEILATMASSPLANTRKGDKGIDSKVHPMDMVGSFVERWQPLHRDQAPPHGRLPRYPRHWQPSVRLQHGAPSRQ